MTGVLEEVARQLRGSNLERAVLAAHGLPTSVGHIAFVNWRELGDSLNQTRALLDGVLSDREGRPSAAFAWAAQPERTASDIATLLDEARAKGREFKPVIAGACRPGVKLSVLGTTKRRHVLTVALANLTITCGGTIGSTIESVAEDDLATVDDWRLLGRIDDHTESFDQPFVLEGVWLHLKLLWDSKRDPAKGEPGWEHRRFGQLLSTVLGTSSEKLSDGEFARRVSRRPQPLDLELDVTSDAP